MSLARGKFGIEYNPRQMDDGSSGLGWVVAVVALAAVLSLTWTLVGRFRASREDEPIELVSVSEKAETAGGASAPLESPPPETNVVRSTYAHRPVKVRNLLMRLEEAERRRDLEMAVTTIEALRALPGSPAADIDDALARRLGVLNVRRLFDGKNAQWVRQVTVGRGDSASRLAHESGSTLASFVRLNGGAADTIKLGSKMYVMDHPRFNLVIHRRARTADLALNGKFFKRYDLRSSVKAKEGAYELPEKKRKFFANVGADFRPRDLEELEMLLPARTSVLISEM